MAKGDPETEHERKARHRHEEAADLVPDSTRMQDGSYTAGIAWEDKARMALARPASARDERDWEAIGRHENPRSGVTGLPDWETRGHPAS